MAYCSIVRFGADLGEAGADAVEQGPEAEVRQRRRQEVGPDRKRGKEDDVGDERRDETSVKRQRRLLTSTTQVKGS